jgi:hypothetical protein
MSEYQGWTNRVTWLMHLHLNNTKRLQQELYALAAVHSGDAGVQPLADSIQNWVEEMTYVRGHASMPWSLLRKDLQDYALAEVNWKEIAQHVHDEVI